MGVQFVARGGLGGPSATPFSSFILKAAAPPAPAGV